MWFVTAITPFIERAIATALFIAGSGIDEALSCTTCLQVSTLIRATLSEGSLKVSARTFAVI